MLQLKGSHFHPYEFIIASIDGSTSGDEASYGICLCVVVAAHPVHGA
jgi:hypothetical protein